MNRFGLVACAALAGVAAWGNPIFEGWYADPQIRRYGDTYWVLYPIDELISYISQFYTLKTGDLLYTGTPVGVGPVHIGDHLQGYLEDRKVLDFHAR